MVIKKQTEKAYLVSRAGVDFWCPKAWYKDGKPNYRAEKAFKKAIAMKNKGRIFDAMETFAMVEERPLAVCFEATLTFDGGRKGKGRFWCPKTMTGNYDFVLQKTLELQRRTGATVNWSKGATA